MTEPRKRQHNLIFAWCALLALLGVFRDNASAAPARTWVLGATVISPEREDAGQVLHVLIEGDRIAAVTGTLPAMPARTPRSCMRKANI